MNFYRYKSKENDRWDAIADKFYNDPYDYVRILAVNQRLARLMYLPEGQIINVPVKDQDQQQNLNARIAPPWEK